MRAPRVSTVRKVVVAAVAAVCLAGLLFGIGPGIYCSVSIAGVSVMCPLGALCSIAASKTITPGTLLSLALGLVFVVAFGRAFCAWACPAPALRALIRPGGGSKAPARGPRGRLRSYALAGGLAAALLTGVPVLCLLCPVGLSLATVAAWWQFVAYNDPSVGMVAFPLAVVVEVAVLRRWCAALCPLGALLSLVARGNRLFRPKVEKGSCLRLNGGSCSACANACPEQLDPHDESALHDCTKCGACQQACPARSLSLRIR